MLKSEFEKRHGKIQPNFSHHWNSAVAKKYGITLDSSADLHAHIWHVIQNSATYPSVETVTNFFKYLSSEPRKEVRDLFLMNLDCLYFNPTYGCFRQTKEKMYWVTNKAKILKTIKRGFKKYRYSSETTRERLIDILLDEYDMRKNANAKKKKFELAEAKLKLQTAIKNNTLPRKAKKEAKKSGVWALFRGRSK